MSTLRVTGLKQETSSATNISLAVGGGVTVAGISTFYNNTIFTNDVTVSGNISVGGTLTYQDVTDVDSIGIITARNGIHVTGGNVGINDTDPDFKLDVNGDIGIREGNNLVWHDASGTAAFRIRAQSDNILRFERASGHEPNLTIDDGNIGIGTTSPTALLEVGSGNPTNTGSKAIINTANSSDAALTVSNWTGSTTTIGPKIDFDNSGQGAWYMGGGNGTNTFVIGHSSDRLTINSTGTIKQTATSFDSVYQGVITTDSPTLVCENQSTDTYYRFTGGTYANASSVNLDLSTHRAKNKGVASSFRIKGFTGTTGSVSNPKLAFMTTTFENDNTTITENETVMELTTSGVKIPNRLYTSTTSGSTGDTRTLTLNNIVEGAAYLVTLTRSPSLSTVSIYTSIVRFDGDGNYEGTDNILNGAPSNMTITVSNASGGTATITYVNGGTQRFRATAIRIN